MRNLKAVFPPPEHGYQGTKLSFWYLIAITTLATGRSLVHILAPDGGANSIAGIDIDVAGGDNIVALFAQWGWEQLLLALVGWVIIVGYRFLIPFALLLPSSRLGRSDAGGSSQADGHRFSTAWGDRELHLPPIEPHRTVVCPPQSSPIPVASTRHPRIRKTRGPVQGGWVIGSFLRRLGGLRAWPWLP